MVNDTNSKCNMKYKDPYGVIVSCKHEKHTGNSNRCIFHAPIEDKTPEDFWLAFDRYVEIFESVYDKSSEETKELVTLDCKGFVFPDIPDYVFSGVVPFNIDFSNARFEGEVNIRGVHFERRVTFSGAIFNRPLIFNRIALLEGIFSNVIFEDKAEFVSVKFEKLGNFENAEFRGNTLFKKIGIGEWGVFLGALFKGDIKFQVIYTPIKIIADVTGPEEYGKYKNPKVWFANVDVEKPKRMTFKKLDLGEWVFAETEAISEANYIDVSWEGDGKPKRKHTRDEYLAVEKLSPLHFRHEKAAEVYRRLRKNFENRLSYSEASDFHKGEMEMRRLGYESKGWRCLFNWNYLFLQGYRIFGGYGERIRNPIISFITVGLAFAGLWSLLGFPVPEGENVRISHNFWYAILFSFKTFLTLPGKAFCLVQELVGAFQRAIGVGIITLFILALRRAFRR